MPLEGRSRKNPQSIGRADDRPATNVTRGMAWALYSLAIMPTAAPGAVLGRGALGGPNKIWVHNPKLAKIMGPVGGYFRTGYSLSEREREIAVITINSKWHSAYPTAAHERAGKAAGLPADKVEALLSGLPTSFTDTREQIVYEIATRLTNSRWVPKGLYDRAVEALGHEGITDVLCLMGFYTSVSMTLAFTTYPLARRA